MVFLKDFFILCVHVCFCGGYTSECKCPQNPEDIDSLELELQVAKATDAGVGN